MKTFACSRCSNTLYFDNVTCLQCGHTLGFNPETLLIETLLAQGDGTFASSTEIGAGLFKFCANAADGVCNWLLPAPSPSALCQACGLNRTIPNLSEYGSLAAWGELERAKKRLVYSLLRFGLPLDGGHSGRGPLIFDFIRDAMTGHLDGVITINVWEADALERERQRLQFDERYRTLLGHLRHESGHYFGMVLVEAGHRIDEFRMIFGDERESYGDALARHHASGARIHWESRHVSAYASSHPWEDWAETWAHYLHLTDAIDTAETHGLEPRAAGFAAGSMHAFKRYDVYREETFEAMLERWVPLTLALNGLNRSMGHHDFYPFILPPPAIAKLSFVHKLIRESQRD